MKGLSLSRQATLCLLAGCALVSCSNDVPTGDPGPTSTKRFLVIDLAPNEAEVEWAFGSDGRAVVLEPELSWEAQFLSPGDLSGVRVVVELLDGGGTACLESEVTVGGVLPGWAYSADSREFALPRAAPDRTPPENPCGVDFVVDTVKVQVRERSFSGPAVYTQRIPCLLHLSMHAQP